MTMDSLLVIFGIVLIVEGIPWFMSPRGTKRMLSELFLINDRSLRMLGFVFMLAGLLMVYFGKR